MKISKNITFKEATKSYMAQKMNIDNTPGDYEMINMQILSDNVFEPIRRHFKEPIRVNSFFRSKELNDIIGGAKKSQHMEGRAIDIDDAYMKNANNADMFYFIIENLDFDQLIWEFGDNENPDWVHVSYVSPEENRRNILRAYRRNGKTVYSKVRKIS